MQPASALPDRISSFLRCEQAGRRVRLANTQLQWSRTQTRNEIQSPDSLLEESSAHECHENPSVCLPPEVKSGSEHREFNGSVECESSRYADGMMSPWQSEQEHGDRQHCQYPQPHKRFGPFQDKD